MRRAWSRAAAPSDDHRRIVPLRWGMLSIALVACVLAGTAAVVERRPTRISVALTASEISYTLARKWSLHDLRAKSVGLSGIAPIRMEVRSASLARRNPSTDEVAGWRPLPLRGGIAIRPQPGQSSLDARLSSDFLSVDLSIEPQTKLHLASAQAGGRGVRIEAIGGRTTGTITVEKTLDLQCRDCIAAADGSGAGVALTDTLRLQVARRGVTLEPAAGVVTIALEPDPRQPADSVILDAAGLEARQLEFHRFQDGHFESTLTGDGKVTFVGSKEAPETVRRGDLLRIVCDGPADVRSLQAGARVRIELDCNAIALLTGTEHRSSSRLPSYLRWWYANETIKLLLAAVTSLAAAILSVLKWFGFPTKP